MDAKGAAATCRHGSLLEGAWRTSIRGPGWDGEGSLVQTKLWNELVGYCQQLQCLRLDLTASSATHAFPVNLAVPVHPHTVTFRTIGRRCT